MFHYTDCGLDNVFLVNGVEPYETEYGAGYAIQHTAGLHKAIGLWLTDLPKPINGAELRFFRLELEMTQKDLGGVLGSSEQCVRRWEKAREASIPGSADRLVRALYLEYIQGNGSVRRMVDRLAALDQIEHARVQFRDTNHGWVTDIFEDCDVVPIESKPIAANDDCRKTNTMNACSLVEA